MRRSLLVIAAAAVCLSVEAQSIFTFAGGGTTDGRIATTLALHDVAGIATDAQGNVYFSEATGNVVHRLDVKSGTLTVFAGNGGGSFSGDGGAATRASLKFPLGLTLDDDGNLYIADHDNDRIRKVDAKSGVITTIAGVGAFPGDIGDGGPATQAYLYRPRGLTWSRGNLYIAQDGFNEMRLRRIAPDGTITTIAGTGPAGFTGDGAAASQAQLFAPTGVAVDGAGNIYIADLGNDRVRRIDAATGKIDTIIGGGSPPDDVGDNGPGTSAKLSHAEALTVGPDGKLYVADAYHYRIRRWDPDSKTITTFAGNGNSGGDDGKPALQTGFYTPYGLAFDRRGNLFVGDGANAVVRRIDATTTIVMTVAGGGTFVGDGLVATSAILAGPSGIALDASGNLFICDTNHALVRKVDANTNVISTFAGKLNRTSGDSNEGKDAKDTILGYVSDIAFSAVGEIFILSWYPARVYKVDTQGKLTTYAGGGSPSDHVGDGGLATDAEFESQGIALDPAGNLYLSDRNRLRKVDARTKRISTIAGAENAGFAGDTGDAAAALLDSPRQIAVDADGNIFVSDTGNGAIRRIDGTTNIITTYAGRGEQLEDGLVATQVAIAPRGLVIDRKNGDLYLADDNFSGSRVRKIESKTQIISTVAGPTADAEPDFSGDNGKATAAKLNFLFARPGPGLALDPAGTLYIADTNNHRVRVVYGCVTVTASRLTSPADGASSIATSPTLTWSATPGAFRYDLYLDTSATPQTLIASDLDHTTFTPSNLAPDTKYFWRVVAKGDPFCATQSSATSSIASFTTSGVCSASAFDAVAPANGAQVTTTSVLLTWNPSPGASTYDVFLSAFNPPARLAAGIADTSYRAEVSAGTYNWFIVAHATCNASQTSSTPLRTFTVSAINNCPPQFTVSTSLPSNGATDVSQSPNLSWSVNGSADSYDLYLGTLSDPPLYAANILSTQQAVSSLDAGTKYYWRVAAHSPCSSSSLTSSIATFTTRACTAPGATPILFKPESVTSGATYSIVWAPASGLDTAGAYLFERSSTSDFSTLIDSQVISSTAASFLAGAPGIVFHRVRAVSGCDPSKIGPPSPVVSVNVVVAPPNVVFTVQPEARIINLGARLEEVSSSFMLENIGSSPVQVIVARQEINSSPPFFSIIDPSGQDAAFLTLEPHKPHAFTIRYSGPPNNVEASYQGVVVVAATGAALPVTPYAFVNLKVGGAISTSPQFIVDGVLSDYAAFPGFNGDDANRQALTIGVRNSGSTPMEVGFEVGPEVWLTTDASWNAARIEPNTTRTVNLFTRRSRAPNGSALPRYTYMTVRTRDGAASRLLVQDNADLGAVAGRPARLDASVRSFIIPEVVSKVGNNGVVATRVRLSNVGSDAVQALLIFTPSNTDGFDQAVRRVTVPLPPNDVVTFTDPLTQVFKLTRPASGQIEVRLPVERIGLISVSASEGTGIPIPVMNRGDGARSRAPQYLSGLTKSSSLTTAVVFAETSGNDHAIVRGRLRSAAGAVLGSEFTRDVLRYGHVRIDDVFAAANAPDSDQATLEISIDSGGGVVSGTAIVTRVGTDAGTAIVSRALVDGSSSTALARVLRDRASNASPGVNVTTLVPIIGAPTSSGSAPSYKTLVGFGASSGSAADFIATFYHGGLTSIVQTFSVPAGTTLVVKDVLSELFGQPSNASGTVFVQAPSVARVYAAAQPLTSGTTSSLPPAWLPLPTTLSEALTSASLAQRPLFADGLEQSIDSSRGSRWMLLLNEVAGYGGVVNVRLYEAANRSVPIAEKSFAISARQQLQLDTVFSALGLDAPDRRKDRTNVQCVVTAQSGNARVSASAVGIDNVTGATQVIALTPSVGSATPSVSVVTPVINTAPPSSRRRAVGH